MTYENPYPNDGMNLNLNLRLNVLGLGSAKSRPTDQTLGPRSWTTSAPGANKAP